MGWRIINPVYAIIYQFGRHLLIISESFRAKSPLKMANISTSRPRTEYEEDVLPGTDLLHGRGSNEVPNSHTAYEIL